MNISVEECMKCNVRKKENMSENIRVKNMSIR